MALLWVVGLEFQSLGHLELQLIKLYVARLHELLLFSPLSSCWLWWLFRFFLFSLTLFLLCKKFCNYFASLHQTNYYYYYCCCYKTIISVPKTCPVFQKCFVDYNAECLIFLDNGVYDFCFHYHTHIQGNRSEKHSSFLQWFACEYFVSNSLFDIHF